MKRLVIIPTYNEEKTIGEVLKIVSKFPTDVLIVDNASTDDTHKVALKHGEYFMGIHKLHFLKHKVNMGKAKSLIDGFILAIKKGYTDVVTMDADMEHDPTLVDQFFIKLTSNDIVVGQRKKYRSGMREILNKWSRFWFNLVIPDLEDVQCGYRGFKVSLLKQMELQSKGFEIEMELLLEAVRNNAKMHIINIDTDPRAGSNLTKKDYIFMNNFFDRWVIENRRELKMNWFKKQFLLIGATIGLAIGTVIETFI